MKHNMQPVYVGKDGLTSREVELQLDAFMKRLREYRKTPEGEADYQRYVDALWTQPVPEPVVVEDVYYEDHPDQLALFDDVA